jgi:hypothetical protein
MTERRGFVVNTLTSYLGSPGLDSRPRRPAILIKAFMSRGSSVSIVSG